MDFREEMRCMSDIPCDKCLALDQCREEYAKTKDFIAAEAQKPEKKPYLNAHNTDRLVAELCDALAIDPATAESEINLVRHHVQDSRTHNRLREIHVRSHERRVVLMFIPLKLLRDVAEIPMYKTKDSAGVDLASAVSIRIEPGDTEIVPTGLAMAVPRGYELQIRPRSGMSIDYPGYIANAPGTIDADYRGEIGIIVCNNTTGCMEIKKGDRIAQGVLKKVETITSFTIVDELDETKRGEGGYGHTGR